MADERQDPTISKQEESTVNGMQPCDPHGRQDLDLFAAAVAAAAAAAAPADQTFTRPERNPPNSGTVCKCVPPYPTEQETLSQMTNAQRMVRPVDKVRGYAAPRRSCCSLLHGNFSYGLENEENPQILRIAFCCRAAGLRFHPSRSVRLPQIGPSHRSSSLSLSFPKDGMTIGLPASSAMPAGGWIPSACEYSLPLSVREPLDPIRTSKSQISCQVRTSQCRRTWLV
nr:hypothetical protein CFP56_21634 [Quercus suber]